MDQKSKTVAAQAAALETLLNSNFGLEIKKILRCKEMHIFLGQDPVCTMESGFTYYIDENGPCKSKPLDLMNNEPMSILTVQITASEAITIATAEISSAVPKEKHDRIPQWLIETFLRCNKAHRQSIRP